MYCSVSCVLWRRVQHVPCYLTNFAKKPLDVYRDAKLSHLQARMGTADKLSETLQQTRDSSKGYQAKRNPNIADLYINWKFFLADTKV